MFEILGMYVGDGCLSVTRKYSEFAIFGDRKEEKKYYVDYVIPLFNQKFSKSLNKKIIGREYPSMGVFGFHIFSKKFVQMFEKIGFKPGPKTNISLPTCILEADLNNTRSFIRGLFDTDGSIYFEKNYSAKTQIHNRPKIKLGTTSQTLRNQLSDILTKLGFKPMLKKPYLGKRDSVEMNEIIIYKKDDIQKWLEIIGFNNFKHQTKVMIWKKSGKCPPYTTLLERITLLKEMSAGDRIRTDEGTEPQDFLSPPSKSGIKS